MRARLPAMTARDRAIRRAGSTRDSPSSAQAHPSRRRRSHSSRPDRAGSPALHTSARRRQSGPWSPGRSTRRRHRRQASRSRRGRSGSPPCRRERLRRDRRGTGSAEPLGDGCRRRIRMELDDRQRVLLEIPDDIVCGIDAQLVRRSECSCPACPWRATSSRTRQGPPPPRCSRGHTAGAAPRRQRSVARSAAVTGPLNWMSTCRRPRAAIGALARG